MGIRSILLIVAVILFVLGALDVSLGDIDILMLGLAFFAGSFLVTDRRL
jgi:hypothetical protein